MNGEYAIGEFVVPMSTSEGTLVASYNRGMKVLNACGGVKTTIVRDAMQRAPVFIFDDARGARDFVDWVKDHFSKIAEEEGFTEIAAVFRKIAVAEARHRDRYVALRKNIQAGRVFKREQKVRWVCRNCGYVHEGTDAVKECPACAHPQAHFEIEAVNY